MLSAPHLPPESLVLSDLLMKTSHPERSGCCKLPLPEHAPPMAFSEQANQPPLAVVGRVSSLAVRDR